MAPDDGIDTNGYDIEGMVKVHDIPGDAGAVTIERGVRILTNFRRWLSTGVVKAGHRQVVS